MASLFSRIFRKKSELTVSCPNDVCPNCWGTQEYAGKILHAMKDSEIDFNNHVKKKSFIQQYVQDQISGSILQKYKDGMYCPKCETKYKNMMK